MTETATPTPPSTAASTTPRSIIPNRLEADRLEADRLDPLTAHRTRRNR